MSVDMPKPATALLRKLEGWSTEVTPGAGEWTFGGLSEEPGADGKRHRVSVLAPTESVLIRAMHVDRRALIVMWLRRVDTGGGWTFDFALRGRDLTNDYDGPKRINSRQLAAYVTAPDLRSALRAVAELAPKATAQFREAA